jgi:hypothetical protein
VATTDSKINGALIGITVVDWCSKKALRVHSLQGERLLESSSAFS